MPNTPKLCSACEALPDKVDGRGRLFLWPPVGPSFGKLKRYLDESGRAYERPPGAPCLAVSVEGPDLSHLTTCLVGLFNGVEIADTKALWVRGSDEPTIADFPRVTSLHRVITTIQSGWLVDMLAEERLTTHFQPIVDAADTSRVYAQEALLRGVDADGSIVYPGRIFQLARDADLLFQVDLAARQRAISSVVERRIASNVFINFVPTAIYDPSHCLRTTVSAIAAAGISPANVVFEVVESDRTHDILHLKGVLNFYRMAGFRVALDDLGAGYSSLNLIHQLRPDIVKLDMELTHGVHADPYKASVARKLLEIAQELRILSVAEGIETVEDYLWLRDHGADFVQGYLFAKPSADPVTEVRRLG